MEQYAALLKWFENRKNFLIVSHYNPDGDGIGSSIAVGILLEKLGKGVALYNRDGVPDNLKFLPWSQKFMTSLAGVNYDSVVMVDCAQAGRVSDEFAAVFKESDAACVDHHILESVKADIKLLDPNAASAGEVVLHLLETSKKPIDEDFAQCIYTSLVVDTGFFKYSNTNAHVLDIAARMVKEGASPWIVAKNIEESYPASRMRLLGQALSSMEFHVGGRFCSMDVTQKMLKRAGATMDQSDEFAVFPRAIENVEVSALFRELEGENVKVSLRSKDYVDVSAIAVKFNGGGHMRAAGFQTQGSLKKVKKMVLDFIKQVVR